MSSARKTVMSRDEHPPWCEPTFSWQELGVLRTLLLTKLFAVNFWPQLDLRVKDAPRSACGSSRAPLTKRWNFSLLFSAGAFRSSVIVHAATKIHSGSFLGIEVNFSLPAKDFPLGPRARDSARLSLEPVQNLTTACRQAAARTRPVSAHKSPSELPSAHLWFWARRQSRSGLNQCRPRLPARMRAFIPFDA